MNLLSSHMASVFHCTTQLPIKSLCCLFHLPVAKPAWHVHLLSCFYPTCRLLTNLFFCCISEVCFHCRIALDAVTYFDCNSKPFFPTTFHFPSNDYPLFLKSHLSVKWKHLGFAFKIFVQFGISYVSALPPVIFSVPHLIVGFFFFSWS